MSRRAPAAVTVVVALGCLVLARPASALEPPPAVGASQVPEDGWPEAPEVSAEAYLLADLTSGQVLAARAPDRPRPVASTVKVLTALTVLERTRLDARLTAGPEVVGFAADAAGVGLDPGESWTVEDLLEGLVARSGNDAAATLAVAVGGSIEGFVHAMRQDAAAVGIAGATIVSPDGLHDGNRLTPRDLLVLTRVAMADPRFADIASRAVVSLPDLGAVVSRNELLGTYPGADGVKTGYTAASGRCIVASARRGGRHLVAVVLGSSGTTGHFADATRLLDLGFTAFDDVALAGPGPELRLKVAGGWIALDAAPAALLSPQAEGPLTYAVDVPVEADGVGAVTLSASWRGHVLGSVDLASPEAPDDRARTGGGAVGGWLADRAYAAMRAATASGLWEGRS